MREPQKILDIIKDLTKVFEKHGNLDLVYAIDDEGNAFHKVYWTPTLGFWTKYGVGEFVSEDDKEDWPEEYKQDMERVVCIN